MEQKGLALSRLSRHPEPAASGSATCNRRIRFISPSSRIPREASSPDTASRLRPTSGNYWKYYNNRLVYGTEGHDRKPKAPFWTDGYFNADDRRDFAYILIHESTGKKSLVVFLSDRSGYGPVILQEDFDEEMGLATQQPVKLSYYPRADANPEVLDMKREGIAFVMFESASSVFVWDPATNAFKRYWISD